MCPPSTATSSSEASSVVPFHERKLPARLCSLYPTAAEIEAVTPEIRLDEIFAGEASTVVTTSEEESISITPPSRPQARPEPEIDYSFGMEPLLKRPPQDTASPIQVEVGPGTFLPLRGTTETLECLENGSAAHVSCFGCPARLACVPDCQLVVCPDCRVLSPMSKGHGVGLGLKVSS